MTKIKIGGKEYNFRLDMRAIKAIKTQTGKDLLLGSGLDADSTAVVAYEGIVSGSKFEHVKFDLTLQQLEDQMHTRDTNALLKAIQEDTASEDDKKEGGEAKGE